MLKNTFSQIKNFYKKFQILDSRIFSAILQSESEEIKKQEQQFVTARKYLSEKTGRWPKGDWKERTNPGIQQCISLTKTKKLRMTMTIINDNGYWEHFHLLLLLSSIQGRYYYCLHFIYKDNEALSSKIKKYHLIVGTIFLAPGSKQSSSTVPGRNYYYSPGIWTHRILGSTPDCLSLRHQRGEEGSTMKIKSSWGWKK